MNLKITTNGNNLDLSGDGGVVKRIVSSSRNKNLPSYSCRALLYYTGKLCDGLVFDSRHQRSGQPLEFQLGKNIFKPFDLAIPTMRIGEKCNLFCKPEYVFDSIGHTIKIPPNSSVIYEIELLDYKCEDISPHGDGGIQRCILKNSDKRYRPSLGCLVEVHIRGKYKNHIFEDRVVQFELGKGAEDDVVYGVEMALQKMTIGELSQIKVKAAYGSTATGKPKCNIPSYAELDYILELLSCDKAIEDWKLCKQERIHMAKTYKDKGTKYFLKRNYPLAMKMYTKCITILEDNYDTQSTELLVAAYNNKALCHQKNNEYLECKQACNKSLELDSSNVKALYRRGECNLIMNNYLEAKADFQTLLQLQPTNLAALNKMNNCKHLIKMAYIKDMQTYANMFANK